MLLKRNNVEVVSLLQKMSNTRERTITLDVEMEDYHRREGKYQRTDEHKRKYVKSGKYRKAIHPTTDSRRKGFSR